MRNALSVGAVLVLAMSGCSGTGPTPAGAEQTAFGAVALHTNRGVRLLAETSAAPTGDEARVSGPLMENDADCLGIMDDGGNFVGVVFPFGTSIDDFGLVTFGGASLSVGEEVSFTGSIGEALGTDEAAALTACELEEPVFRARGEVLTPEE